MIGRTMTKEILFLMIGAAISALLLASCKVDIAGSPTYPPDTTGSFEQCTDSCYNIYDKCLEKNTKSACYFEYERCNTECRKKTDNK